VNRQHHSIFPFQVDQRASFASFFCTPSNSDLLNRLKEIVFAEDSQEFILIGNARSGKSFLIQSICNELTLANREFSFVPMSKALDMGVGILQNLASLDVVCIDDLQCIADHPEWEEEIFHLINECQQSDCSVIFSLGGDSLLDDFIALPDLLSRLKRMERMKINSVDDNSLHDGLLFVSKNYDINLGNSEIEFLLRHYSREFSVLVENVLLLDRRAGELKRKITVPLIKEILSL